MIKNTIKTMWLEKISGSVKHHPLRSIGTTEATTHLFISNSFKDKRILNLFGNPAISGRKM